MYTKCESNVYYRLFVLLIGILLITGKVYAQAEPSSARASEFPDDTVLITEEVLKSNPALSILKWPNDEQIREREVKVEESNVLKLYGQERFERVIKPDCIPSDILERLLPLRYQVKFSDRNKGCDALLARYKCGKYLVQSIVTSSNIRFVIRDEKSATRKTDKEKLKFIEEIIEKMFNKSDVLLETGFSLTAGNRGLEGKVELPEQMTVEMEGNLRWHDTFSWWTDGEIACILICSSVGTSGGSYDQEDWFAMRLSYLADIRPPMGELTQEMIDQVLEVKDVSKEDVEFTDNDGADAKRPVGFIAIILCGVLVLGGVFVLLRRK